MHMLHDRRVDTAGRQALPPTFRLGFLSACLLLAACGPGSDLPDSVTVNTGVPEREPADVGAVVANGSDANPEVELGGAVGVPDAGPTDTGGDGPLSVVPSVDPVTEPGASPVQNVDTVTELVDESPDGVDANPDESQGRDLEVTDAIEGEPPGEVVPADDATALELIDAHSDLGTLSTALRSSALFDYLSSPGQRTTIFALSDRAFERLSATQRADLLADTDRMDDLLRRAIFDDRLVTTASARVGVNAESLAGRTMRVSFEDDAVRLSEGSGGYYTGERVPQATVSSTVGSPEAVVHVIDDLLFFEKPRDFVPDPGSVAAALADAPAYAPFAWELRSGEEWLDLGDISRRWTVLVPPEESLSGYGAEPFRLRDHLVETTDGQLDGEGVAFRIGTYESLSGGTLRFTEEDGVLRIEGREVTTLAALRADGGVVHDVSYPVIARDENGEAYAGETILALLDRLALPPVVEPGDIHDPGEGGMDSCCDDPALRTFMAAATDRTPYAFMAALIRETESADHYGDPYSQRTLVVPERGLSEAEIESRFGTFIPSGSYGYYEGDDSHGYESSITTGHQQVLDLISSFEKETGVGLSFDERGDGYRMVRNAYPTMYERFARESGDDDFSMIPSIFPTIDVARDFLAAHTFPVSLTTRTLRENVGTVLETEGGQLRGIDEEIEYSQDYEGGPRRESARFPKVGGQRLQGWVRPTINGSVLKVSYSMVPTHDAYDYQAFVEQSFADAEAAAERARDEAEAAAVEAAKARPGSLMRMLQDSPSHSRMVELIEDVGFTESFQDEANNGFVLFAPTNDAFGAEVLDDPQARLVSLIMIRGDDVQGPLENGTYQTVGSQGFAVELFGSGDQLQVNGIPATYGGTGPGGTWYSLDGMP